MDFEKINKELMPCPFCGGAAHIKKQEIWGCDFYLVKCGECHCRTTGASVGFNCFTGITVTEQQAAQRVVHCWNNRAFSRQAAEGETA